MKQIIFKRKLNRTLGIKASSSSSFTTSPIKLKHPRLFHRSSFQPLRRPLLQPLRQHRKTLVVPARINSLPRNSIHNHSNNNHKNNDNNNHNNNSIAKSINRYPRRSLSLQSSGSDRRRSRTTSPVFPSTHFRKSTRIHRPLDISTVWNSYKINPEITYLAAQFINTGRSLPPIAIPTNLNTSIQWPSQIPLYFITIKPERQRAFLQRVASVPAIKPIVWTGVNGRSTDLGRLIREGKLGNSQLKKGEIGCYLSHLKLWEKIVADGTSKAFICEDDVNLTGNVQQVQYLNQILNETQNTKFDILFLSWFRFSQGGNGFVTTHTKTQWTFCQLWMYMITLEGAKKLLADARVRNMYEPVDVAMWSSHCRQQVNNIVAYPPLCLTVGASSDTSVS